MSYKWIKPAGVNITVCNGDVCNHVWMCNKGPCPYLDKIAPSLGYVKIPVLELLSYYEQMKESDETRNS